MMTEKEIMMYDLLVEFDYFTEDELKLVRCIMNGTWEEIMNRMIFARWGCRNIADLMIEYSEELPQILLENLV